MPAVQEIIAQDVVTSQDVELLARASAPCITAVLSIPNPLETEALFKNAIRDLEKKLKETASGAEIPGLRYAGCVATASFAPAWAIESRPLGAPEAESWLWPPRTRGFSPVAAVGPVRWTAYFVRGSLGTYAFGATTPFLRMMLA